MLGFIRTEMSEFLLLSKRVRLVLWPVRNAAVLSVIPAAKFSMYQCPTE